ncbi:MAG: TerB family tellurite resistance protein [Polyangiaceae bacterium]
MDVGTRRRVCELVVGLIATDDELHPSEFRFMVKVFASFGVSQTDEEEVIAPTVRAFEAAKAMRELPEEVHDEAIELLVAAAAADGKIVEAERVFLRAVAGAIDLSTEALDERLAKALETASAV